MLNYGNLIILKILFFLYLVGADEIYLFISAKHCFSNVEKIVKLLIQIHANH